MLVSPPYIAVGIVDVVLSSTELLLEESAAGSFALYPHLVSEGGIAAKGNSKARVALLDIAHGLR